MEKSILKILDETKESLNGKIVKMHSYGMNFLEIAAELFAAYIEIYGSDVTNTYDISAEFMEYVRNDSELLLDCKRARESFTNQIRDSAERDKDSILVLKRQIEMCPEEALDLFKLQSSIDASLNLAIKRFKDPTFTSTETEETEEIKITAPPGKMRSIIKHTINND